MALFGFRKNKEAQNAGGDFSIYDSMDKVQGAVKKGILAPMYLISPVFGGAEDVGNILYVPPAIIQHKDSIDNILADALQNGKRVQGFSITPQYRGKSIVPCSIDVKAGGDVDIAETINIW